MRIHMFLLYVDLLILGVFWVRVPLTWNHFRLDGRFVVTTCTTSEASFLARLAKTNNSATSVSCFSSRYLFPLFYLEIKQKLYGSHSVF